ncbi:MAG: efflux RND transporter periplasmic adaptor subunit [Planctomycetota bacterium]
MQNAAAKAARYFGLTAITVAACAVMWWVSQKDIAVKSAGKAGTTPPPPAAAPKPAVRIATLRPGIADYTIKYSGKIRAWEEYSLGFEIGGRVLELGADSQGNPLDDGAPVAAGQLLARLDDRILRARRAEAVAQEEQATSDLARARNLRDRGGRQAITDAEYQEFLTSLALAKAQREVASKNLEDAVLVSPVKGRIARRMVEAGESVNPHAIIFEVVQNEDVLLKVDVPEARVRELEARARAVRRTKARGGAADPESAVFRAHVQLEGRDLYGKPWPPIRAEVYRIAQLADERTGLFEVEVRIPNADGLLRPGMVATAEIVVDRLLAYQVPEEAVIFRGREAYLFHLRPELAAVQSMFWEVGQTELQRAERVSLTQWIDQGDRVLVPAAAVDLGPIVVRGQQRLGGGQLVRVSNPEALPSGGAALTARRPPAAEPAGRN